ncbi:MAG: hypothetical protein ACRC0G_07460 [Fusobacteriaceae bacterium]
MKKFLTIFFAIFALNSFGYDEVHASIKATSENIRYYLTGTPYIGETYKAEQIYTEINQRDLIKKQNPVKLDWSLERDQLIRRTKLWNDKNKVSFIYLFNKDALVGFYTIKGKVSSVNSQLTSPEFSYGGLALPSPSEDGSYGSNGDAVFFFLTDGSYMEWNGTYLLVDRPMKLNVKPIIYKDDM